MIYFPLSAALAALRAALGADRLARRGGRGGGGAGVVAPNLAWNAANDFATLHHTADNADWSGARLDLARARSASGRAVRRPRAGLLRRLPGRPRAARGATRAALPRADVAADPRASSRCRRCSPGANANWAAAGARRGAGARRRGCWRRGRAGWRRASRSTSRSPRRCRSRRSSPTAGGSVDNLVLARYVGQGDLSRQGRRGGARGRGLDTLVSGNRAMLADFFYTLRDERARDLRRAGRGLPAAPLRPEASAAARAGRRALRRAMRRPRAARPACPGAGRVLDAAHGFRTREVTPTGSPRRCWFPAMRVPSDARTASRTLSHACDSVQHAVSQKKSRRVYRAGNGYEQPVDETRTPEGGLQPALKTASAWPRTSGIRS